MNLTSTIKKLKKICSKSTIKKPERCYWWHSCRFVVNCEQVLQISSFSQVSFTISLLESVELHLKGTPPRFSLWTFSGILQNNFFQNTSCSVSDFSYLLLSKIFPPRRLLFPLPITKTYLRLGPISIMKLFAQLTA